MQVKHSDSKGTGSPERSRIKAAVGYSRLATASEGNTSRLHQQEALVRDIARTRGLVIARFYRDEGTSGLSLDRPGLQALLRACRAGRVGTVVLESADRLTRSPRLLSLLWNRLHRLGVRLVTRHPELDERWRKWIWSLDGRRRPRR